MSRVFACILLAALGWLSLGNQSASFDRENADQAAARFAWVDVFVTTGDDEPLGAWQVDLVDASGHATIVGIEGGEHPAYAEPPTYDPRAMAESDRVILAAFSTDEALPTGRTRVARVHVRLVGDADWNLSLTAAADDRGRTITPSIELEEGSAE